MGKTSDEQPGAGDDAPQPDSEGKSKSKAQRAREAATVAQQVASGNSALTSALLLHGLPLLAHVLPHTPQLFVRLLLSLTKPLAKPKTKPKRSADSDEATASDDSDDDGATRS